MSDNDESTQHTQQNNQGSNCQSVLKFLIGTFVLLIVTVIMVSILFSVRLRYLNGNGYPGTVYDQMLAASLDEPFRTLEWVSRSLEEYFADSRLLAIDILNKSKPNPQNRHAQLSWKESKKSVEEFLFKLKKKCPSQPQHTWFKLYSALTSTLTQEIPGQPSTLVFLSSPSTKHFSDCLAKEISIQMNTIIAKVMNMKNSANIMEISPQSLKSKDVEFTHNELNYYLDTGKVVIVRDLDQINVEEHLFLFHAFCDQFEAPDKRATFIFLITIPPDATEVANSLTAAGQENELVELILDAAWTALSPDKRPAIISRVATTVIRIQPGDSCP